MPGEVGALIHARKVTPVQARQHFPSGRLEHTHTHTHMAATPPTSPHAASPAASPVADKDSSATVIEPLALLQVPGYDPARAEPSELPAPAPAADDEYDAAAARLRFTNRDGEDKSYLELSIQTLTGMYGSEHQKLVEIDRDIKWHNPYLALNLRRQELEACTNNSAPQVKAFNFAVTAVQTFANLNPDDLRQTSELIGSAMYHFHKGPADRALSEATCKDIAESMDLVGARNAKEASERAAQKLKDRRDAIARQAAQDVGTRISNTSHRSRRRRLN